MNPQDAARFHEGDHDHFKTLVERLSPRLLSVAMGYQNDVDAAHDLVQETWIRAYERRRQFRGTGSLLGWLIAITRSLALSRLRLATVRDEALVAGNIGPDRPPTPEEAAARGSLRRALLEAIHELPDRQRQTVVLRLLEGKSVAETATLLDCAEGTVKAALHAALKNLTPKLEDWAP